MRRNLIDFNDLQSSPRLPGIVFEPAGSCASISADFNWPTGKTFDACNRAASSVDFQYYRQIYCLVALVESKMQVSFIVHSFLCISRFAFGPAIEKAQSHLAGVKLGRSSSTKLR